MAERLCAHLGTFGFSADIAQEPLPNATVNHWMIYTDPWMSNFKAAGFYTGTWKPPGTVRTMMITHIDDNIKNSIVRETVGRVVDAATCMSEMTRDALIEAGVDGTRLRVIPPAHDEVIRPRRLIVGITSRVYPDGRKRESLLAELAKRMKLDCFHFEIYGAGWDGIIPSLDKAGATVEYLAETGDFGADYGRLMERIPGFDYYLYAGMDEGSMGTLDALAAGVKTIVTPQGFHCDIPGGITHGFSTLEELVAVFREIVAERESRRAGVAGLTWAGFASRHADLWRELLGERPPVPVSRGANHVRHGRNDPYGRQLRSLRRAISSDFRKIYWESRRYWFRGLLSRAKRWALSSMR